MRNFVLSDLLQKEIIQPEIIFCCAILAGTSCSEIKKQAPNIIFIMADDHAAQAVSAYGSIINTTPNIDRLASEGAIFMNSFCTNSICAPSRAVILTGKYSHINGVKDNLTAFDGSQETFPKLLQTLGYQTALVGKWHLKSDPTGFDYWNILPGQGEYHNPKMIENGVESRHKGYVTDIITDQALQWLNKLDENKPFCLLVHHKATHANWETDEKHSGMFSGMEIPEPETFNDDYRNRVPQLRKYDLAIGTYQWNLHYKYRFGEMPDKTDMQEVKKWMYQRYIKDYLKCVASLDDNVGRILKYLDETGLMENTIVIYTSDQGFFLGEHGLYDKRLMYEESLRMPLLIRYPEEIKPASVINNMVLNLDFAETILDYAGAVIPGSMQGKSFRYLAQGKSDPSWRNSMYYRFYEKQYGLGPIEGVRTDRYKLIHYLYDGEGFEMFDLENDPHEMQNLYYSERHTKIMEQLKEDMRNLKTDYKFPD